jgi:hypothetical protein
MLVTHVYCNESARSQKLLEIFYLFFIYFVFQYVTRAKACFGMGGFER